MGSITRARVRFTVGFNLRLIQNGAPCTASDRMRQKIKYAPVAAQCLCRNSYHRENALTRTQGH
jgi:hypothetical protein